MVAIGVKLQTASENGIPKDQHANRHRTGRHEKRRFG
jgi:hypothetical protein